MKEQKQRTNNLQVRIQPELKRAIRYKAVDLDTTITDIVERALKEWLERHKENTIEVE